MSRPALDCHAHIAPDISAEQLRALNGALVFAVSRSLGESAWALQRTADPTFLWGLGVHPASGPALRQFDAHAFERLLPRFVLVGEIGLDRRAGSLDRQRSVFAQILKLVGKGSHVCSIHSTGCAGEVIEALERHPVRAPVLHWFTGSKSLVTAAVAQGCWFSVNSSMSDEQLSAIPPERTLPETDFPSATARRPGDVVELEDRLERIWGVEPMGVRALLYANLTQLFASSSVRARLPAGFQEALQA